MSIRDHNYKEIIEHTKKAFHNFSKRYLAKQIIQVLQKNKVKKEAIVSQSEITVQIEQVQIEGFGDKKNYFEDNQSISKNTTHLNKQTVVNVNNKDQRVTKISELSYGDYVIIDAEIAKEQWRIYSNLQGLKIFKTNQVTPNVFYMRKSCFQIIPPTFYFQDKDKKINSNSMICLKNIFTGHYIHLTSEISKTQRFGYELKLQPQISKSALFKFVQNQNLASPIRTDEYLVISSYYRPDINISMSEQNLLGKVDRSLIGSYSELEFKLIKIQDSNNMNSNPYFYIHCVEINKNLEVQELTLQKFTIKKQIRQFEIEQVTNNDKSALNNQNEIDYCKFQFFQLTSIRPSNSFRIRDLKNLNLCQIWQMQKICQTQQGLQCRIRNVISNQQLTSECKQNSQGVSTSKRNTILQFKRQQKNQYIILNDQNISLTAVYDNQSENYILKYEQVMNLNIQNESLMSKTYNYRFELFQLDISHSNTIYQLLEVENVLKNNYMLLLKWGFHYEDRNDKIKYSLIDLKKDIRLMRIKIKEINSALNKLALMLKKEENNLNNIQNICKQLQILEILIIYCQIIKIKIGKPSEFIVRAIYTFASNELKQTLFKLFDIIFLLTYHNKRCSQIIIEHNVIFNQLLKDYNEQIGCIIQEAIKNLCILTNKIVESEDVIFSWTTHIQQITDPQLFQIQKQYIDIIAEVVVDPNDIGIHPYQYKIKQQLIGNRKKKILPKFSLSAQKTLGTHEPLIIFEYDSFPIETSLKESNSKIMTTTFRLKHLFYNRKNKSKFKDQVAYIGSMLKLMRNLCKDRNKKLSRVMQDYGLTIQFMHSVFKNKQISWQIITKFLDLYCVMYIVQDPFLSFEKREVKCYSWQKISNFDFNLKTGKLFNQFTEEVSTQDKQRDFDIYILPIFDHFFEDFQKIQEVALDHSKIQSFYNIISIIYEVVNYGYLNHKRIQKYVQYILKFSEIVLRKETKNQKKQKIILKVVQLFSLAQQIWTIIQGMNLLLIVYKNLKSSNTTSNEYLMGIFTKALDYDQQILQQKSASTSRKRKISVNMKSSVRDGQIRLSQKIMIDHHELDLQIVQFTLKKIVQNRFAINNRSLQLLLHFLQTINNRGQRMCDFLNQIFILNNSEAQKLYIQYSGIAPLQSTQANASRRLLNVMKVKELVDKITQQNLETQDETRKKEKILQLKNLLMKIINNLDEFKKQNNQLFRVCQTLLKKLKIHSLLIEVMKFYDKQNFQSLINEIILFFIQFIRGNQDNLIVIAEYFPLFTKKYSYQKLPELLLSLFTIITNKQECFWMIYRNIDKKMEDNQKQILFQCIYNIIKISPATLLDNVKGQVIYNLITNNKFQDYIKGTIQSPNFINIICFIGNGSVKLPQRIKESITKTQILESLMSKSKSYTLKSIHLNLYHFLYINNQTEIDQVQCQQLISKVFLSELKHLPSSCHYRASEKLQLLRSQENKLKKSKQYDQLEQFISQFRNLLMEGGERIETSVEEQYFLYLLKIQSQNQLSLLTCLQQILLKFKIINIQPLSSYIFKIIGFMESLFVKEEQVYQSRILNKLYEISTVIQEKYNRTHRRSSAYEFQIAYSKVQVFFKRFATIIQQQNISYFNLLKCAKIRYCDLQMFRNQQKKEKLIIQSEFFKFMNDLVQIMNNKSQFSKLTQQGIIKQFYILYSQKDSHKLNIIKFISKLMEVLQYQKNANLYNYLMELKKIDQFKDIKNEEKADVQVVNCKLLKKQLSSLADVFSLHLKQFMSHRIKQKLQSLLQQADSKTFPDFLSLNSHNIVQSHSKNNDFSITNLIVFEMLESINFQKLFQILDSKIWQNYFQFVNSTILTKPNPYIIKILYKIYENIKENESVLKQYTNHLQVVFNTCFQLIKFQRTIQPSIIFSLYRQIYNLINKISKNPLMTAEKLSNMQILIANNLILIFENYSNKPTIYWGKQCHCILSMILASFTNYTNFAKVLSNSTVFIDCFQQLLRKLLNNGITNTNTECQEMILIINDVLRLLKKIGSKLLTQELAKIIINWPFKTILEVFEENYLYIYEKKYQKSTQCQRNYICSDQFCNYDKLTDYDRFILEILINMLLIVHIGSDILTSKELIIQLDSENKQSLLNYHQYLQGKVTKNKENLGIMRTVPINIDDQCKKVCFMLPYNGKFKSRQLQQQVQEQLKSIIKEHYFQNIYHLSWYVQSQYEDIKRIDNSYISKHIVSNSQILQYTFIAYLFIMCILKIFTQLNIPNSIVYTINTIIICSKLILLVVQGKKLYIHHRLLKEIKYDKKIKLWKYFQILLSIFAIIGYFFQYCTQQFYALTFALQILKIRSVGKMIVMILQVAKSLFYVLLFFQSIILTCTFQLFEKISKSDNKSSLIDIYFNLAKQIIFLQFMPLVTDDTSDYALMKLAPQFLPMFTFTIYFMQSVILAYLVIKLLSFNTRMKQKHEKCGICGLSKEYLQSSGKKYEIHIKYEHSVWNYIQFFIYIRNKTHKQIEEMVFFELIQKQDFRFLKVSLQK